MTPEQEKAAIELAGMIRFMLGHKPRLPLDDIYMMVSDGASNRMLRLALTVLDEPIVERCGGLVKT